MSTNLVAANSRRQLLNALQNQILPRLQQGNSWRIVLGEPPFRGSPEVALRYHNGKPLAPGGAQRTDMISSNISLWPEAQVHSSSVPFMGFVLEGEIDWRVGITAAMAKKRGGQLKHSDYAVLGLPKSTFFIAPPGVPYGTGMLSHWERSTPGVARSIFWMRFYPLGMQCHMGHGDAQGYKSGRACIFPESRLYFAVQSLLEELRLNDENSMQAVQGLLVFIVARLARGLRKMQTPDWRPVGPEINERSSAAHAVEAASAYIEANFHQRITLDEIAAHALASPTHLCHIFRREKGVTLTEYIAQFRMEYASSLLQHTRMNIKQIAQAVGYGNQAYFCQVFSKHFECPPSEFRTNSIKQKESQNK